MSGSSNTGAPPPGVVRSSALSFVASAQPASAEAIPGNSAAERDLNQADRMMPAGLKSLCETCSRLYPDQPNPLQVTTRLKYWLGGHDPLDYISMYWNPGKPEEHIPPHWHYVSFGLSDLHGDGRVHPAPAPGAPSGYGLELTVRLSADAQGAGPPLWPAALLQALARYVFTTGNRLSAGDHVSWHRPLDGAGSRLRHLLVAEDPQLGAADTPHGSVNFLQVVGCTGRELKAAQRRSGFEVLKLMSEDPNCGGAWLVTRLNRRTSAKRVTSRVNRNAPAQLSGVSARVRWMPWTQTNSDDQPSSPSPITVKVEQQIKDTLQRGLSSMSTERGPEGHMSTDSFEMSSMERALPQIPELMEGSWRGDSGVEYLDGVHIILNAEGASLLPLAIDGRVAHGLQFTWRECGISVTFVPQTNSTGRRHIAHNAQLQVMIPKELAQEMSTKFSSISKLSDADSGEESDGEPPAPPLSDPFVFTQHAVKISVLSDSEFV